MIQGRIAKQQVLRPMDDMRYSWASPQEDEFALLALGAPSPYQALLLPSLMLEPRQLLDVRARPRDEQECWSQSLLYFLRLLTVQQGKAMVLKSPSHGFKLPILPFVFPQARFVIIERNPYEVFASNLKLWRTLLDMYSLDAVSADQIETFVLAAYIIHEEAMVEGIAKVNPGLLSQVRYEDLVADPIGQMERLYSELGLADFESVRLTLEQHLSSVANHQRNRFAMSAAKKARVDEKWGPVICRKGYSWASDYLSLTA
jgi:hypothetical protein